MGTGYILARVGTHPPIANSAVVRAVVAVDSSRGQQSRLCCIGSTSVQMPSDSTPKHHSSPWYMPLNECKQQLTDKMFISPLWVQPPNSPHETAPAWVQGTAPSGHQSTNEEVRQVDMYYQKSRKKSLDDYFSLRNVRTWQIAFETQQSMAAEITSKTKQTELKALEKQVPFSSWVSWKRKQKRLAAA